MTEFNTDGLPLVQGRYIGVDDFIQVLKHTGCPKFVGKIRGWWINTDTNEITAIDVWGGRPGYEKMRSVRLEHVEVLSTRMQNKLQREQQERMET